MARITLTVSDEERDALVNLARFERRDPRAQAALELRRVLEHAGYLPLVGNYKSAGCAPATTHEVQNA